MHAVRPILLNLADRADLVEAASGWTDRVDVVTATSVDRPADAVLIRPDGYVAWAAAPGAPGGADALRHALRTWFGLPTSLRDSSVRLASRHPRDASRTEGISG
ncbi:hypothetical protein ACFQX6_33810 [Streptosporangium lutulentum]